MAHGPRCPRSVRQETSSLIFSRLALPFSQKVYIMSSRSNSVTHSCYVGPENLVILRSSLIPQPLTFPPHSTRACFILSCGRHRLNYGLKEAMRNTNPANNRNKDSLYLRLRKEYSFTDLRSSSSTEANVRGLDRDEERRDGWETSIEVHRLSTCFSSTSLLLLKPATHLVIIVDHRDRQLKSPGVSPALRAYFTTTFICRL